MQLSNPPAYPQYLLCIRLSYHNMSFPVSVSINCQYQSGTLACPLSFRVTIICISLCYHNFCIRSAYHNLSLSICYHNVSVISLCFFSWRETPPPLSGPWPPPHSRGCLWFLDHTQRRATVGRTSLDEWSARRIYLYLTTHNTHNRQTSTPPVGFEPMISAGERP